MERENLNEELEFVRSQIQVFKTRASNLDEGNWKKNISDDFDKDTLWSSYIKITSELKSLLRRNYDAEIM